MNQIPFVDIHTHKPGIEDKTITVQNILPNEKIEKFRGRNFYSVGLHPWNVSSEALNDVMISMVKEALEHDHVCFVGECGLDKIKGGDFSEQVRVFRAHAVLADEFKRPLIIHCVKAYNEILEIHQKMRPEMPWIFHGYTGGLELTKQFGKRGFLFSFGKILFNTRAKAIESLRWLPMERVFFETDEAKMGVHEIYEKAAILKNVSPDLLAQEVWNNFNRVESSLISRF
jgi:TatD DNase family protein